MICHKRVSSGKFDKAVQHSCNDCSATSSQWYWHLGTLQYTAHSCVTTEWRAHLDFSPGQGILGPEGHVLHTPDASDLVPAQAAMLFPQLHHHFSLGFKLPAVTQTSACLTHIKTPDKRNISMYDTHTPKHETGETLACETPRYETKE